jgi:hypothetical protein
MLTEGAQEKTMNFFEGKYSSSKMSILSLLGIFGTKVSMFGQSPFPASFEAGLVGGDVEAGLCPADGAP